MLTYFFPFTHSFLNTTFAGKNEKRAQSGFVKHRDNSAGSSNNEKGIGEYVNTIHVRRAQIPVVNPPLSLSHKKGGGEKLKS